MTSMWKLLAVLLMAVFGVMLPACDTPLSAEEMKFVRDALPAAQEALALQAAAGGSAISPELKSLVDTVVDVLKDQGVLEDWVARARFHGLNPTLKLTFGEEKFVKIGLDGVDLDASASLEGTGTLLPMGARQSLIDVLEKLEGRTDPEAVALRNSILDILGWNRAPGGADGDR